MKLSHCVLSLALACAVSGAEPQNMKVRISWGHDAGEPAQY
jgi:hypothetical protein